MKHTKTFQNASVVSINQGTITIQEHCGRQLTLRQASLVSLLDGNINLNIEYPDFKKGDILFNTVFDTVFIFKEILNDDVFDLGYTCPALTYITSIAPWDITYLQNVRYATEEEKQRLFKAVSLKYHKIWNPASLTWEEGVWKPKKGESYWHLDRNELTSEMMVCCSVVGRNTKADNIRFTQNNYFETLTAAKEALEKIQQVLDSYHN